MAGAELKQPRQQSLARVPGAGRNGAGIRALRALTGGSVNNLWRVDTDAGHFLLREDGPAWRRPGVNRQREGVAHAMAAEAGLAPRILARSDTGDWLVCEFIDGRVWTSDDFGQATQRERLCELLGRVHRLALPRQECWPFEPLRLANDYAHAAAPGPRVEACLAAARLAAAQLDAAAAPRVLTHGDPLPGNVIESAGRLWLIDWEFTQCADPVWDLAAFAVWFPESLGDLTHGAERAGIGGEGLAARLDAALVLHRALGSLWYLARGEAPPAVLETRAASGHTSAPRA